MLAHYRRAYHRAPFQNEDKVIKLRTPLATYYVSLNQTSVPFVSYEKAYNFAIHQNGGWKIYGRIKDGSYVIIEEEKNGGK
jgi:hypothetical protein